MQRKYARRLNDIMNRNYSKIYFWIPRFETSHHILFRLHFESTAATQSHKTAMITTSSFIIHTMLSLFCHEHTMRTYIARTVLWRQALTKHVHTHTHTPLNIISILPFSREVLCQLSHLQWISNETTNINHKMLRSNCSEAQRAFNCCSIYTRILSARLGRWLGITF